MTVLDTARARQAALLLHTLPVAAREQVFAQLNAAETVRLQPLLTELTELGISATLGQQLLQSVSQSDAAALYPRERAEQLCAETVLSALDSCDARTIAHLLRSGPWSWQARLLEIMPAVRRAVVIEALDCEEPVLGPAALAVLHEELCKRALASAGAPTGKEHMARPSLKRVLRGLIPRWIPWMR